MARPQADRSGPAGGLLGGVQRVLGHGVGDLDDAFGDAIDAQMVAHHRRRLHRIGQDWVLERGLRPRHRRAPEWWVPTVEVLEGNRVEVLVDGWEGAERIAKAIRNARRHVLVAAWHASPDFRMGRDGTPLRDLLAETSRHAEVRLLMWAGAPLPVFPPSRAHVRADRSEFERDCRVQVALDRKERPLHCHHEKLVVVDDEVAFVGGLDLTHLDGNRHDDRDHSRTDELGWHDVLTELHGPVVSRVANHVTDRWAEVTGERLPRVAPGAPAGDVALQLLRTVPEKTYDFLPDGEFTILAAYLQALRSAEHLVYLENQFLWSPEVVEVLCDKLAHPPHEDFRVVLVVPLHPSSGKDTTCGQIGQLIAADDGRGNLLAATLLGPTADSDGVYVHAKVGIVDDRWMTIGSANLNEHSLYNDTEVNIATRDPHLVRRTRLELWSEHLAVPVEEVDAPAHEVVDRLWHAQCEEQEPISRAGGEPVHRIRRVPGLSRRVDRVKGPLVSIVVDG